MCLTQKTVVSLVFQMMSIVAGLLFFMKFTISEYGVTKKEEFKLILISLESKFKVLYKLECFLGGISKPILKILQPLKFLFEISNCSQQYLLKE